MVIRSQRVAFFGKAVARQLDPEEVRRWSAMDIGKRGRWMAGRLAAKAAVRAEYSRVTGHPIPFRDIAIVSLGDGRPAALPSRLEHAGRFPFSSYSLSISHAGGLAVAAFAHRADEGDIGIDIEPVRTLSRAFCEAFMSPGEYRDCQSAPSSGRRDRSLLYWCLKEAHLKALGTGLRRHPRSIPIVSAASGRLSPAAPDARRVRLRLPKGFIGAAVLVRHGVCAVN